jgi:hypothetical protein
MDGIGITDKQRRHAAEQGGFPYKLPNSRVCGEALQLIIPYRIKTNDQHWYYHTTLRAVSGKIFVFMGIFNGK